MKLSAPGAVAILVVLLLTAAPAHADHMPASPAPRVITTPAGYIELEAQADDNNEIAYFGLLPAFTGQRLGGYLLSEGVAHAWANGARRVWVHTCNLDGPTALANYQARGFRVYDQRFQWQDLPMIPPGPWPGAGAPPPAV